MPQIGRLLILVLLMLTANALAQTAPGGFVEAQGTSPRTRYSAGNIAAFMPTTRGPFTFPAPYGTQAARLTDATDCQGSQDCVWYVGYSYWRNSNNHVGSSEMLVFIGTSTARGGAGPLLLHYNKTTGAVTKTALFNAGDPNVNLPGEGYYFSGTIQDRLYIASGKTLKAFDVAAKTYTTILDITNNVPNCTPSTCNRNLFQMHSSNNDNVHIGTILDTTTGQYLACFAYTVSSNTWRYYPKAGALDECNIDKSGRWLFSIEDMGVANDLANRWFDNITGFERTGSPFLGPNGTLGHMDTGYDYALGADGFNNQPNATIRWDLNVGAAPAQGPLLHFNSSWNIAALNHISHANAVSGNPLSQQFACGSNVSDVVVQDEITCIRMDAASPLQQLIVAPVMTSLTSSGGCCDSYAKYPKGNLDITGQYFIWTANMMGSRLDAFLVKVPSQLLVSVADTTAPAIPTEVTIQ